MTDKRLKQEYNGLRTIMGDNEFRFLNINTDKPNLVVAIQTNSKNVYTVKIDLSNDYPNVVPKVFITSPKPMLTHSGKPMLEPNHAMHTLGGENGCVRVCHYGGNDWHPNVSLYQVVIKIRFWLEMYEAHKKTGLSLDQYLTPGDY